MENEYRLRDSTVLFRWEGNRRSGVALAMRDGLRHRVRGIYKQWLFTERWTSRLRFAS